MVDDEDLNSIIREVREAGFLAKRRTCAEYPFSVICAERERDCGSGWTGISFWVTWIRTDWYLCCWMYRYWKIPPQSDIAALCIEYLTFGDSIGAPPAGLIETFGLCEIDYDEFSGLGLIVDE